MPDGGGDISSGSVLDAVRAAAGELSVIYHLFHSGSAALRKPAGAEMLSRLAVIHPDVSTAADEFREGMSHEAANRILDLLDSAGVDLDTVIAAEGRAEAIEKRLLMAASSWYTRAKTPEAPKKKEEVDSGPSPCFDGSRPSKLHEVWIGAGAARNDYPQAREWLTGFEYDGKSPAWWLSRCVTGLPFTVEGYTAIPGYLGVKPNTGEPVFRLIITRRDGKVIVLWWGTKTEYNRLTSQINLVRNFKALSTAPAEKVI